MLASWSVCLIPLHPYGVRSAFSWGWYLHWDLDNEREHPGRRNYNGRKSSSVFSVRWYRRFKTCREFLLCSWASMHLPLDFDGLLTVTDWETSVEVTPCDLWGWVIKGAAAPTLFAGSGLEPWATMWEGRLPWGRRAVGELSMCCLQSTVAVFKSSQPGWLNKPSHDFSNHLWSYFHIMHPPRWAKMWYGTNKPWCCVMLKFLAHGICEHNKMAAVDCDSVWDALLYSK